MYMHTKPSPPQSEPIVSDDEMIIPGQSAPTEQSSNIRAVAIGLLVTALILIFIGLFVWGSLLSQPVSEPTPSALRPTAAENNEPESTRAEAVVETAAALSPSDSLDAIVADLENTDTRSVRNDLTTIEGELANILRN